MSCTGGKQEYADTIECLRYPERVFEHRYLCWWGQVALEVKIHTEKLTGDWKGFCDKTVLWGAQSYILPASGLCFQSLLLCTKTSKERNHNTGALNVSAATFLLGSNSFQRNDTVFVFLFWLPKGYCCRETSSARKCKLTSAFCHCFCVLCSLSWAFVVLLFFPPPKKQQKQNKRSRYWVERVGQCHPRFPVSGNSFVLGLLLSCWIPAPAGQSDYRGVYVEVCFWDVCPVLNVVYFSPAPGSLTKLCCQNLPPLLFLSTLF